MGLEFMKFDDQLIEGLTPPLVLAAHEDIRRSFLINAPISKDDGTQRATVDIPDLLVYPNRMSPEVQELLTSLGLSEHLELTIVGTSDQPVLLHPNPKYPLMEIVVPKNSSLTLMQDSRVRPTRSLWMGLNPLATPPSASFDFTLESPFNGSSYAEGSLEYLAHGQEAVLRAGFAKSLADSLRRITRPRS